MTQINFFSFKNLNGEALFNSFGIDGVVNLANTIHNEADFNNSILPDTYGGKLLCTISPTIGYSLIGYIIVVKNLFLFDKLAYRIDWKVPHSANGETVFHLIVRNEWVEVLSFLKYRIIDADFFAVDKDGLTAFDKIQLRFKDITQEGCDGFYPCLCKQKVVDTTTRSEGTTASKHSEEAPQEESEEADGDSHDEGKKTLESDRKLKEKVNVKCLCCSRHEITLQLQDMLLHLLQRQMETKLTTAPTAISTTDLSGIDSDAGNNDVGVDEKNKVIGKYMALSSPVARY